MPKGIFISDYFALHIQHPLIERNSDPEEIFRDPKLNHLPGSLNLSWQGWVGGGAVEPFIPSKKKISLISGLERRKSKIFFGGGGGGAGQHFVPQKKTSSCVAGSEERNAVFFLGGGGGGLNHSGPMLFLLNTPLSVTFFFFNSR